MMKFFEQTLPEVLKIERKTHFDQRGFFSEFYREDTYGDLGDFVQDNHSYSKKGVIRGMHFQSFPGQAKLVSCLVGKIYDVFVDIRPSSPNFGKWGYAILDGQKHEQLYIPVGFAHGFATLSEEAHVLYKVSSLYNPITEKTFRFDDRDVGIDWPVDNPILSEKDQNAPPLREVLRDENLDLGSLGSARTSAD